MHFYSPFRSNFNNMITRRRKRSPGLANTGRRYGGAISLNRMWTLVVWSGMAVVLAMLSPTMAPASPRDLTELSIEDLMTVEVTTTVARKPQRVTDTAAAVFVITAEDIRRSGVTSIPEALRMVPGLQVARIDANKWAISARGFNGVFANKLLVLMDGRTVYSPWYSGVFWDVQDTLLEDVSRIEVIRGPGASLWGANAVNGVINIITRPAAETQGGLAVGITGTEERATGALRYGGKMGDAGYYRAYAKYAARDAGVGLDEEKGADDWHLSRGGGRMDWQWGEKDRLTLQGDIYDGSVGTEGNIISVAPPYVSPFAEQIPVSGGNVIGRLQHNISPGSDINFQLYYDRTNRTYLIIDETRETYDLDFQHRFQWGERQEWMWGFGYRQILSDTEGSESVQLRINDRTDRLWSFFLQDEIHLVPERLSLLLGTKIEKNDYTDVEYQPNARLLWTPTLQHTFWTAVSRAVRTPAQAEHDGILLQGVIITPGSPNTFLTFRGDPSYKSEELTAYELGYRFHPKARYALDLALFFNQYDDLRSLEAGTPVLQGVPPYVLQPVVVANKMQGCTYGAELAADYRPLDGWRLQAAYTYLEMDLTHDDDSTDAISASAQGESPKHMLSLRSAMDLGERWALDFWLRYTGDLPAQNIDAILAMDARLAWHPTKRLELSVVGQNLLDDVHPEYNPEILDWMPSQVERSVYGKVMWHF